MKKLISFACCLLLVLSVSAALAQIDVPSVLYENGLFAARLNINPDEEPVYIILDQMTIAGEPFFVTSDNFSDMWSGYPLGSERHALIYEFCVQVEEGYVYLPCEESGEAFARVCAQLAAQDGAEASFRVTLLAPKQEIVQVDCTFTGDSAQAWQQIDAIAARGDTPVESDEPYTVRVPSGAMSCVRYDEPVCCPLGDVEALLEHANMRIVEQETFAFRVGAAHGEMGE